MTLPHYSGPEKTSDCIELFSSNPEDYRSDVLRKLIPLITNPRGKNYHLHKYIGNMNGCES